MDDPTRFLQLFLEHQADLKAYIGSLVRDRAARDDVFQDLALTLWKSFATFDSSRSFGAWARGVATNKILQAKRKSARFPVPFAPEVIQAVQEAYDRLEAPAGEREEALSACLEALPGSSRTLLELKYRDRLRGEDIARRVNSTADAVYQNLSRLRTALELCVKKRLKAGGVGEA